MRSESICAKSGPGSQIGAASRCEGEGKAHHSCTTYDQRLHLDLGSIFAMSLEELGTGSTNTHYAGGVERSICALKRVEVRRKFEVPDLDQTAKYWTLLILLPHNIFNCARRQLLVPKPKEPKAQTQP